jgi:hypothetical protein
VEERTMRVAGGRGGGGGGGSQGMEEAGRRPEVT